MGTHKGSKTRSSSTSPARKHKSRLSSKKPASMAQNARSQHFLPRASVVEKVKIKKGWEEWEDQLLTTLRKEGKTFKRISQRLPGRTGKACEARTKRNARGKIVSTHQEDAIPFPAPQKLYQHKKWEDWEDQIVTTHCNAGKSWEYISKLLPPRTVVSVKHRWKFVLNVNPQPKAVIHWKEWEDQVLETLVESGQKWAEIAKQLPGRSADSCRNRWSRDLLKLQGPSIKKNASKWQDWEERLLVSGYHAGLNWAEIAGTVQGRTLCGTMNYWHRNFHASDQDKTWTSEELALLAHLRSEGSRWDEISQALPGHSSNACRTQWYKETEGIQGPSNHRASLRETCKSWSTAEVETLIALYNTIGPRWEEMCKYIPGRTAVACEICFYRKCTNVDGVGGPPSEYWKEFFMNESGSDGARPEPTDAVSDSRVKDQVSPPRPIGNQKSSVDARKKKVIDIPMV